MKFNGGGLSAFILMAAVGTVLLLLSARASGAEALAMVTSLVGNVTVSSGKEEKDCEILMPLFAGDQIRIGVGSELTLVYFRSAREYTFTSRSTVRVGAEAPETDSVVQVDSRILGVVNKPSVSSSLGKYAQGGVVLRNGSSEQRIKLVYPVQSKVLNRCPGFEWTSFPVHSEYRFELWHESGEKLIDRTVQGSSFRLPEANGIDEGVLYTWRVSVQTPTGESSSSASSFSLLDHQLQKEIDRHKPADDASFPERMTYARFLEDMGLEKPAELYWKELFRQPADLAEMDVATSLNNLAVLYEKQGRYSKAEPLYQRALSLQQKSLGIRHPDVATTLSNLAFLYNEQGRYAEAWPLYKRALSIREQSLGAEHPDVASSLNNLAAIYEEQGRYAAAEPLYRRALKIREKSVGQDHSDVAESLNNLAVLSGHMGRYGETELLYRRAITIMEKNRGRDHEDLAPILNNLAVLYDNQGRYSEAIPLYMEALKIDQAILGDDHPDLATSFNNLAILYDRQGFIAKAEPFYQKALRIREQKLDPEHPTLANSLHNLAYFYDRQGRYADAELLYERALEIREKVLGTSHPQAILSLEKLLWLYEKWGRGDEARLLHQKSLVIEQRLLKTNHATVGRFRNAWYTLRYRGKLFLMTCCRIIVGIDSDSFENLLRG